MRVISEDERIRGDFCRAMRNRVVLELSRGKELRPLMRIIGTEDTEISFDFLIGSFSLSISLGVVGSGEADIVFERSSKFSGKG